MVNRAFTNQQVAERRGITVRTRKLYQTQMFSKQTAEIEPRLLPGYVGLARRKRYISILKTAETGKRDANICSKESRMSFDIDLDQLI